MMMLIHFISLPVFVFVIGVVLANLETTINREM